MAGTREPDDIVASLVAKLASGNDSDSSSVSTASRDDVAESRAVFAQPVVGPQLIHPARAVGIAARAQGSALRDEALPQPVSKAPLPTPAKPSRRGPSTPIRRSHTSRANEAAPAGDLGPAHSETAVLDVPFLRPTTAEHQAAFGMAMHPEEAKTAVGMLEAAKSRSKALEAEHAQLVRQRADAASDRARELELLNARRKWSRAIKSSKVASRVRQLEAQDEAVEASKRWVAALAAKTLVDIGRRVAIGPGSNVTPIAAGVTGVQSQKGDKRAPPVALTAQERAAQESAITAVILTKLADEMAASEARADAAMAEEKRARQRTLRRMGYRTRSASPRATKRPGASARDTTVPPPSGVVTAGVLTGGEDGRGIDIGGDGVRSGRADDGVPLSAQHQLIAPGQSVHQVGTGKSRREGTHRPRTNEQDVYVPPAIARLRAVQRDGIASVVLHDSQGLLARASARSRSQRQASIERKRQRRHTDAATTTQSAADIWIRKQQQHRGVGITQHQSSTKSARGVVSIASAASGVGVGRRALSSHLDSLEDRMGSHLAALDEARATRELRDALDREALLRRAASRRARRRVSALAAAGKTAGAAAQAGLEAARRRASMDFLRAQRRRVNALAATHSGQATANSRGDSRGGAAMSMRGPASATANVGGIGRSRLTSSGSDASGSGEASLTEQHHATTSGNRGRRRSSARRMSNTSLAAVMGMIGVSDSESDGQHSGSQAGSHGSPRQQQYGDQQSLAHSSPMDVDNLFLTSVATGMRSLDEPIGAGLVATPEHLWGANRLRLNTDGSLTGSPGTPKGVSGTGFSGSSLAEPTPAVSAQLAAASGRASKARRQSLATVRMLKQPNPASELIDSDMHGVGAQQIAWKRPGTAGDATTTTTAAGSTLGGGSGISTSIGRGQKPRRPRNSMIAVTSHSTATAGIPTFVVPGARSGSAGMTGSQGRRRQSIKLVVRTDTNAGGNALMSPPSRQRQGGVLGSPAMRFAGGSRSPRPDSEGMRPNSAGSVMTVGDHMAAGPLASLEAVPLASLVEGLPPAAEAAASRSMALQVSPSRRGQVDATGRVARPSAALQELVQRRAADGDTAPALIEAILLKATKSLRDRWAEDWSEEERANNAPMKAAAAAAAAASMEAASPKEWHPVKASNLSPSSAVSFAPGTSPRHGHGFSLSPSSPSTSTSPAASLAAGVHIPFSAARRHRPLHAAKASTLRPHKRPKPKASSTPRRSPRGAKSSPKSSPIAAKRNSPRPPPRPTSRPSQADQDAATESESGFGFKPTALNGSGTSSSPRPPPRPVNPPEATPAVAKPTTMSNAEALAERAKLQEEKKVQQEETARAAARAAAMRLRVTRAADTGREMMRQPHRSANSRPVQPPAPLVGSQLIPDLVSVPLTAEAFTEAMHLTGRHVEASSLAEPLPAFTAPPRTDLQIAATAPALRAQRDSLSSLAVAVPDSSDRELLFGKPGHMPDPAAPKSSALAEASRGNWTRRGMTSNIPSRPAPSSLYSANATNTLTSVSSVTAHDMSQLYEMQQQLKEHEADQQVQTIAAVDQESASRVSLPPEQPGKRQQLPQPLQIRKDQSLANANQSSSSRGASVVMTDAVPTSAGMRWLLKGVSSGHPIRKLLGPSLKLTHGKQALHPASSALNPVPKSARAKLQSSASPDDAVTSDHLNGRDSTGSLRAQLSHARKHRHRPTDATGLLQQLQQPYRSGSLSARGQGRSALLGAGRAVLDSNMTSAESKTANDDTEMVGRFHAGVAVNGFRKQSRAAAAAAAAAEAEAAAGRVERGTGKVQHAPHLPAAVDRRMNGPAILRPSQLPVQPLPAPSQAHQGSIAAARSLGLHKPSEQEEKSKPRVHARFQSPVHTYIWHEVRDSDAVARGQVDASDSDGDSVGLASPPA